jgi:hypothetical protein
VLAAEAAVTQGDAATQLLSYVSQSLAGAPIADQVLGLMQRGGAAINVLPDAQFAAKYGRASGIYDPATKQVTLPESVTKNPEELRIVLLHEGVHWVQDNVPGGIAQAGGAVAQALQGAGALGSPDRNTKAGSQQDEAQAFLLEAMVARELGISDPGMGTSNGRVLGYGSTLARVQATPEYQ